MGMNATDKLNMHSCLRKVSVICDKAHRLACLLAVSAAGYAVYELEIKQVQDVSPVDVVTTHETVERVLLNVEDVTKRRGAVTVGILHHEKRKQKQQVENLDRGKPAVLRFPYSKPVSMQPEAVHDGENAVYCEMSIILQEKFLQF
jgi:hypothetical protein